MGKYTYNQLSYFYICRNGKVKKDEEVKSNYKTSLSSESYQEKILYRINYFYMQQGMTLKEILLKKFLMNINSLICAHVSKTNLMGNGILPSCLLALLLQHMRNNNLISLHKFCQQKLKFDSTNVAVFQTVITYYPLHSQTIILE